MNTGFVRNSMRAWWAMGLVACGHGASDEAAPEPDLSERVAFAVAVSPDRVPVATLPAQVVPAPGGRHDMGPGVSGRLVRWLVSEGDEVLAGQPLAELQSQELASLSARQTEQASAVAQAEEALRIAEAGAARGVRSSADVQVAKADLAAARAAYGAARAQLAALDTTTREGGVWVWRAPVAGVVDHLQCPLGGVQATDVCLGLVSGAGVQLEVEVPERHLLSLSSRVQAEFLSADGRAWTFDELGRAPAVSPLTRARSYRFGLATEGDAPLQGMSGRARLTVAADGDTHQVAKQAVTWVEGVPTVYVRRGEGYEADPRQVEVVGREDELVVVRGLEDGEEVAVRGVFLLKSLAALEDGA